MDYRNLFRVHPATKVNLDKIDPGFRDKRQDKEKAAAELDRLSRRLGELQYLLYAENRRSLLICLQAMDAGGKDGTINHVFAAMNPQGARVQGFKVPSREEAAHDFLWRIHHKVPAKGEVVIFNRSHYEDVLVTRVHGLVPREVWRERFALINDFEQNLAANGTHILKFYLHISPEEQLRRFKQRLDDPSRHWKISDADYTEREFWPDYRRAYEDLLRKTSTNHAPWFVIPADRKWFRNLAVSRIVVETLDELDMKFPAPSVDIDTIRTRYHAAEQDELNRSR